MSVFDKDIIEQDTKLYKFCNRVKKWIKNEFLPCYRYHYGVLIFNNLDILINEYSNGNL